MRKLLCGTGLLACSLVLCDCGGVSSSQHNPVQDSQVPRSSVQHLIVVIMQNNSFDHLFGTYPGANGLTSTVPGYQQIDQAGNAITPQLLATLSPPDINHTQESYNVAYDSGKMDKYAWENGDVSMGYFDQTSTGTADDGQQFGVSTLWNYAKQYALADNFFASAMASEPSNMLYMVSAGVGVGKDAFGYPQLDGCSAALYQQNQGSGASLTAPLAFQNVGDQLSAANISWRWAHEDFTNEQNGSCKDYVPQENPFQYFQSTANSAHLTDFALSHFTSVLSSSDLPSVMWINAAPEHSMHPGADDIANGIEWLDNLVQAVKGSNAWGSSAIMVIWDESGGWYDHVAPSQLSGTLGLGARVPMLVISPFAKTNYISHQQMDFVSILRFIQWNWAVGKFSDSGQAARETQSGDICDLLTSACKGP